MSGFFRAHQGVGMTTPTICSTPISFIISGRMCMAAISKACLSQQLIYRLACLGYEDTVAAYGSDAAMWQSCEEEQIRGLLSPRLGARRRLAW
jgi:hypothetical protein